MFIATVEGLTLNILNYLVYTQFSETKMIDYKSRQSQFPFLATSSSGDHFIRLTIGNCQFIQPCWPLTHHVKYRLTSYLLGTTIISRLSHLKWSGYGLKQKKADLKNEAWNYVYTTIYPRLSKLFLQFGIKQDGEKIGISQWLSSQSRCTKSNMTWKAFSIWLHLWGKTTLN